MGTSIFVLLPAFNEASALAQLIPTIGQELKSQMPFQIVVVDDGSQDNTQKLLGKLKEDWPVQVLRHERNSGYGAALRTGFLWIIQNAKPSDIAVSLDADNTHLPKYIPDLINKLNEGYEIATASYWIKGGRMVGVPLQRRLMSRVANGLFRLWSPLKGTRCFTNGFRAYRVSILQEAYRRYGDKLIEQTGFPGGTELLLKAATKDVKTAEVPFMLRYDNRGTGSKIHILSTIRGYLGLLRTVGNLKR